MLQRQHAEQLVQHWPHSEPALTNMNQSWWHTQHGHGLDSPDEQYLHTLLHQHLGIPYIKQRYTIMEEVCWNQYCSYVLYIEQCILRSPFASPII